MSQREELVLVTDCQVRKEILNISSKKETKNGVIPGKVLKKSVNIYINEIRFVINNCIENWIFSDSLKLANVSPVFKKEDNLKKNDRPFSILPHMSKAFESFLLIYLVLEKAITLNIRSIFVNECNLAISSSWEMQS